MTDDAIIMDQDVAMRLALIEARAELSAIHHEADARAAADDLAFVQSWIRAGEQARSSMLAPLRNRMDEIRRKYDELLRPMQLAEGRIKAALLNYRVNLKLAAAERARIAADERAKEAAEAAMKDAADAGLNPAQSEALARTVGEEVGRSEYAEGFVPTAFKGDAGRATIRRTWTFEVIAELDVPRRYLVVDTRSILEAIRIGVRDIPGVRIFQREGIAGSRR